MAFKEISEEFAEARKDEYTKEQTKKYALDLIKEEKIIKAEERRQKQLEKANKPHEEEKIKVAGFIKDGKPVEMVWNPETKKSTFVFLKDGQIEFAEELDLYVPLDFTDEILTKNVVSFAEKPEEYGTEIELLNEIRVHITKYLDVPDDYLTFVVYYVLMTWVFDRLNSVAYLRARGDTGTGKSRFLDVTGNCCYRRTQTSGTTSPAVIFRLAGKIHGTLIIDEADRKSSDTSDEVVKILNQGFERGRPVTRCATDNPDSIEVHDVFCPKIISSRYEFYDKALESRCLTHIMKSTTRDIPFVLGSEYEKESKALRNKLLMYRLRNWDKINPETINEINLQELTVEPRIKQIACCIFPLLHDDASKTEFFRFIEEHNRKIIEERAESLEGQIINVLVTLWEGSNQKE